MCLPFAALAQGGDKDLRTKADALFAQGEYAQAMPLYSQLVSLTPDDRELSYRYGTCSLYGGEDKEKAIGFLKYATEGPAPPALAWYFLGKAYHLTYHFAEALAAYEHYRGTADKKAFAEHPVDALEQQCRNGKNLLSNLKEIAVHNKVEVAGAEFFRFYDLSDIGGKIVVTPDELKSSLDKKSKITGLVYLPAKGGPIYFSSYGKDGKTGRDIYRTELLPTGEFATPVKLAGYINTNEDEDYACMAPDGRSFYFSSKGHNSMGGYDVFRSTYDKASDVFGPPENLDFAVNTPDDDVFYLVDAEGKEACFASGRDSKQGMLHVYRVGTTQAPINITVLKGTFASQFDPADRKAHIVVEDALTREQVADVSTDINGDYVLALPRGGKYKFMVQAGPSGRTHAGMVELPRAEQPQAFRQEMRLIDQGGEKLMIKNYFDAPLQEDIIALALDEIKRRARLDVNGSQPVAQRPAEEKPTGDVMTRAGFTGDRTPQDAVRLAQEDAAALTAQARQEGEQARAAYTLALAGTEEAEQAADRAKDLVAQAGASDEAKKNELMMQAARERQRSREANTRARAAYRTAQDLDAARLATEQRGERAAQLSTTLAKAVETRNDESTLAALQQLKARLDERDGPSAQADAAERIRRTASEKEKEAAKKLQQANARRDEENELADRIGRSKRGMEEAKGKRKEDLAKEIAQLEEQQRFLREEVGQAFTKAKEAEREAAMARGQAGLMMHLSTQAGTVPAEAPDAAKIAGLGERIGANEARIAATTVDERYDAAVAEPAAAIEQRTFDWGRTDAVADVATPSRPTEAAQRAPEQRTTRTTTAAADALATAPVDATAGVPVKPAADAPVRKDPPAEERPATTASQVPARAPTETASMHGIATPDSAHGGNAAEEGSETASGSASGKDRPAESASTPEADDPEEEAFLLANQLAELRQLRLVEKDKVRQDSLDRAIAGTEQRMRRTQRAEAPTAEAEPPSEEAGILAPERPEFDLAALEFDPAMLDSLLLEDLYPGFLHDRRRIMTNQEDPERGISLHGLEMMLVDSIDAQVRRQLAMLEKAPEKASVVLPRLERLRTLKQAHLKDATALLEQANAAAAPAPAAPVATAPTPHNDSYIAVASRPDRIYESVIDHRSPKVAEAVALKDKDLERMMRMEETIDSLETALDGMPGGKAWDKLRQRTDRLIDDHLILRTELGQRMGHVMNDEFAAAKDSTEALAKRSATKGFAPDEPLLKKAQGMEGEAAGAMLDAAALRKRAERTENIVVRDSLYRQAYAAELGALRTMDRAQTVRSYMLSDDFRPGEDIAYALVERRLFDRSITPRTWAASEGTPAAMAPVAAPSAPVVRTPEPPAPVTTAQQARERSAQLERGSLELQARAVAQRDSAATVRGQQQQRMAQRAEASRHLSDSLHVEAQRMDALAQRLGEEEHVTAERETLKKRLADYYFLSAEEQTLVVQEEDHSRYFQAKVKSLDQRVRAGADLAQADSSTKRATELARQATTLRRPQAGGTVPQEQRMQEAAALDARAARLTAQADSLRNSARNLDQAATVNDAQAAVLLQGLPEERSTAIMAMEQRTRRPGTAAIAAPLPSLAPIGRPQPAAPVVATAVPATAQPPASREPGPPAASVPEQPVVHVDGPVAMVPPPAATEPQHPAAPASEPVKPSTAPPPDAPASVSSTIPASRTTTTPMQPVATERPQPTVRTPEPPASVAPVAGTTLANDVFTLGEGVAKRSGPIAVDAPMPQGVVFKVQIGAFRKALGEEAFSDMTPVTGEHTGNGLIRYTAGMFTSAESATKASQQVRERGYRDAFVVAYQDGKRIPLQQARRLVQGLSPVPGPDEQPIAARPPAVITPPAAQPPVTAPAEEAVLASYPASAEQVLAAFRPAPDATAYYNDPSAAPAKQVETIRGLFFTVQVGVYSKPTALDRLFNITPLNSERTETGKIRYTTGIFLDLDRAKARKEGTVALGVTDAFVTAYLNGKRIPMRDARALLARFGTAVLADPALVTR